MFRISSFEVSHRRWLMSSTLPNLVTRDFLSNLRSGGQALGTRLFFADSLPQTEYTFISILKLNLRNDTVQWFSESWQVSLFPNTSSIWKTGSLWLHVQTAKETVLRNWKGTFKRTKFINIRKFSYRKHDRKAMQMIRKVDGESKDKAHSNRAQS